MFPKPRIAVITGPTASGKSALALEVAKALGAEIISADSMQVYRGMDIGTAKPTLKERALVPHHLIDVAEITENYNAGRFRLEAARAIEEITARGNPCLVVGGTILYIKILLEGLLEGPARDENARAALETLWDGGEKAALYEELAGCDPALAERLHPNDRTRIIRGLEVFRSTGQRLSELQRDHGFGGSDYEALIYAVTLPRALLYERINQRTAHMIKSGWIEEVRRLLKSGADPKSPPMQAIGYREIVNHLAAGGASGLLEEEIAKATRHFAKRQETWLKKMGAVSVSPGNADRVLRELKKFLQME